MESTNNSISNLEGKSEFNGGMLANFFIGLATLLASLFTLGLAYPAMVCWKLKWEANHTYLNGKQLVFDGNAMQLMGKYVLWLFLSVITFGLYYIFSAKLKLTEWKTKHTHFADYQYDENENRSRFNGKWYQLFAVNFVCNFIVLVTLFIGYYWAHCYKERWYCKHKTIDDCQMVFDGTGLEYFGKRIIWTLLTFITCGVYSFWLQIKSVKWTVSHTKLLSMQDSNKEEFSPTGRNRDMEILYANSEVICQGSIKISNKAFYNNYELAENISIANSVKSIGEYAFYNCKNLKSVFISKSVKSVGWAAFYGCGELTIYCQADSAPRGWNGSWDYSDSKISVVWSCKMR